MGIGRDATHLTDYSPDGQAAIALDPLALHRGLQSAEALLTQALPLLSQGPVLLYALPAAGAR